MEWKLNQRLNSEKNSKLKIKLRNYVQIAFFFFTVYTFWRFYWFVMHFDKGTPYTARPQSIDAFLPIGSFMALKNWILTGIVDPIHPAGMVLIVSFSLSALILRKGFCSWICPFGTMSEGLGNLGRRIFGRNFTLWDRLDKALRGIKYVLMFVFVFIVLLGMNTYSIKAFLMSPYWSVADVKLLDFWINPGTSTLIFILIVAGLSIPINHFWCRYLCPYGALLGIYSYFSPAGVNRDVEKCNDCKKCNRACSSRIQVSETEKVGSLECIACFECVESCPKGALEMKVLRPVSPYIYLAGLLVVIFGIILIAKFTGHWDSALKYEDYVKLLPLRDAYSH